MTAALPGRVVLDASALLAYLHDERGASEVASALPASFTSAVNWCEVAHKAGQRGVVPSALRARLQSAGLVIVPFDLEAAEAAAALAVQHPRAGLSLADRACLALAGDLGLPALTADRRWTTLRLPVEVVLVR